MRAILTGGKDVSDHQPPAWTEYSDSLLDCFLSTDTTFDVMNGNVRDDHVKAIVFKGQSRHVGRMQLNSISYPFSDSIAHCDLSGVARLIPFPPEIDSHCPARGQPFARQDQSPLAPTPHLRHPSTPRGVDRAEHPSQDQNLTPL